MYQLKLINIKLIFLSIILAAISFPIESSAVTSVTQHGITWTFADDETCGQFVNGDYWCVSPVSVTGISPGYTSSPRAMNGSMVNPGSFPQGYDSQYSFSYSSEKNVGIGVSSETPLILSGDVSLVTVTSNNPLGGVRNDMPINTAAVLTVLTSIPPDGSFRPGISSTTKTLHNISSVDRSKLSSFPIPDGISRPNISTYAGYLQMPWLTHDNSGWVETIHPMASGLDDYYFPAKFAEMALMLNSDYSAPEKETLLINYIQLGIDCYSYIEGGGKGWEPDGGMLNGRKLPILFTGVLLNYTPMKNIGQRSGDYLYSGNWPESIPEDYIHFAEDGQSFYVTQADIDITNRPYNGGISYPCDANTQWCPDERDHTPYPYSSAMLGMPEWAIRHSSQPYASDSSWSSKYRLLANTGLYSWVGVSLAARMIGASALWNNQSFFDVVDRYVGIKATGADPFGFSVQEQSSGEISTEYITGMWNTYRDRYRNRRLPIKIQAGTP